MSLFTDASLVYVPSGVKDGKTYSITPTDGSGDLTFSRGSDIEATRVNANGYIEKAQVNLLLQSNSFDTTWVLDAGITLTSGQSGYDGSSDAWLLSKGALTYQKILQNISVSGICTLSVYAKAGTLSQVTLRDSASQGRVEFNLSDGSVDDIRTENIVAYDISSVGNDWYRCQVSFNGISSGIQFYPDFVEADAGNIYIQDAQLNYGLVAQEYQETTTTSVITGITNDMPRLDYSGGASCPSLKLEGSRTNSILFSEYIGAYFFYTNASATNNATTSPEGVVNAASIIPDATSGLHQIASSSISASGSFTLSAFVKAGELNKVAIRDSYATGAYASFDLSTGTKIEDNVSGDAFIEAYSNGWYRIGVTYTYSGNIRLGINILDNSYTSGNPSSGANYWSSNGTDKLYVYGLQCELGASYVSSMIPTYGTSATRTADACSKTGVSSLIGQTAGTLFVETNTEYYGSSNMNFALSDGSNTNNVKFIYDRGYSKWKAEVNNNGSPVAIIETGVIARGTRVKLAMAYANNDFVFYMNGSLIGTDPSGSTTFPVTLSKISTDRGDGIAPLNGNLYQALVFKTRLSNADLATLTTL